MNTECSIPTALEMAPGYLHRASHVEGTWEASEPLSRLREPTMRCTSTADAAQGFLP